MSSAQVVVVAHPHVRVDKDIMHGSPYVMGSRVPVRRIYLFYKGGAPVERIAERFPQLGLAKVLDALSFAFDNEERIKADIAQAEDVLKHGR